MIPAAVITTKTISLQKLLVSLCLYIVWSGRHRSTGRSPHGFPLPPTLFTHGFAVFNIMLSTVSGEQKGNCAWGHPMIKLKVRHIIPAHASWVTAWAQANLTLKESGETCITVLNWRVEITKRGNLSHTQKMPSLESHKILFQSYWVLLLCNTF